MADRMRAGYLRDALGRLVVSTAAGALLAGERMRGGFVRDTQDRIIVVGPEGEALAFSDTAGEKRMAFSFRDHGFTACTVTDPAHCSQTQTPEAGKPLYFKIPVHTTTNFATIKTVLSQAASAEIANAFIAVFNKDGNRLGVSANQATNWKTSGERSTAIVADEGKSLVVTGSPTAYAWAMILIGTQGVTPAVFRAANGSTNAPNFNLAAGATLRTGTTGVGLSAAPASFNPALLAISSGPILLGA